MENQLTRSLYSAAVQTANKLTQGGKKNNNNQGKVIERKKKKKEIEVEKIALVTKGGKQLLSPHTVCLLN